jgi:hypothetical protein
MTTRTSEFYSAANIVTDIVFTKTYAAGGIPPEVTKFQYSAKETQAFGNWFNGQLEPQYKYLIRNHMEATTLADGRKWKQVHKTPAFIRVNQVQQSKVSPFFERVVAEYNIHGIPVGLYPNRNTAPQNVRDDVHARHVKKAMAKIDAIRGSMASGEDVGELSQTIRMLASPFQSLRRNLTDYIESLAKFKRARMSPKKFLDVATDAYLEYTFGVKPLESSISQIVIEAQRQGSRFEYVPFSVTTTKEWGGSVGEVDYSPPNSPFSITFGVSTKNRYVERWQGEVKGGGDANGEISQAKMLGLTPDKWLPTLWNLIPYSFVLDYVANVGDIINGLTFRVADVAWCCVTTRHETSTQYSSKRINKPADVDGPNSSTIYVGGGAGGQQFFECVEFYRDRLRKTDFLVPLQVKIPEAWSKPWLNVAALMNSGFRAKNQSYY